VLTKILISYFSLTQKPEDHGHCRIIIVWSSSTFFRLWFFPFFFLAWLTCWAKSFYSFVEVWRWSRRYFSFMPLCFFLKKNDFRLDWRFSYPENSYVTYTWTSGSLETNLSSQRLVIRIRKRSDNRRTTLCSIWDPCFFFLFQLTNKICIPAPALLQPRIYIDKCVIYLGVCVCETWRHSKWRIGSRFFTPVFLDAMPQITTIDLLSLDENQFTV